MRTSSSKLRHFSSWSRVRTLRDNGKGLKGRQKREGEVLAKKVGVMFVAACGALKHERRLSPVRCAGQCGRRKVRVGVRSAVRGQVLAGRWAMMARKSGDDEADGGEEASRMDWDGAWKKQQEKEQSHTRPDAKALKDAFDFPGDGIRNSGERRGIVFDAPGERQIDERTTRLVDFWSNDKAFLAAIGAVLLLVAFYAFVFVSGGIGTMPTMSPQDIIEP
uniref:Uncharacterized protein n=1 Tax=Erythrolobus australicus TaxID=1077150 RepID=A0A7S1TN85_9RHOD|mmetsp:Transcript_4849/g.12997  ORF Transcript_4849/g.12997 Transcript_4849/m.12997 type:complete len:220 (+) Transcript_4849:564-1223(+)